jgi:erythronate-4-phosphate dehydrogenase
VEFLALSLDADLLTPVRLVYDPFRDDRALRATLSLSPEQQGKAFDQLRRMYPERREFATLRVSAGGALERKLEALGFATDHRSGQLQQTTGNA